MGIKATDRMGIKRWRYDYALKELRRAYDASREAVDNERKSIRASMDDHVATKPEIETDDDQYDFELYQDQLGDSYQETEGALRLIREGFTVILHHFWEKQALGWYTFRTGKYEYGAAYKNLPGEGYLIQKKELEKLRKTANVIKHDSRDLYGSHRAMFRMNLDDDYKSGAKTGYYPWLDISDADIDGFFETLRKCGPDAKPRIGF